jgi:hypothetical protein
MRRDIPAGRQADQKFTLSSRASRFFHFKKKFPSFQGFADESALMNPGKFGQGNYKAAYGKIQWWLKRRWSRLAVITAVETRYAGLGYAGGSAQQQAAAFHAKAHAQGDWREDGAFRQREEETTAPFFGGFGGG